MHSVSSLMNLVMDRTKIELRREISSISAAIRNWEIFRVEKGFAVILWRFRLAKLPVIVLVCLCRTNSDEFLGGRVWMEDSLVFLSILWKWNPICKFRRCFSLTLLKYRSNPMLRLAIVSQFEKLCSRFIRVELLSGLSWSHCQDRKWAKEESGHSDS